VPVHQLFLRDGRADGHARRQRLGSADHIRLHAPMLDSEPSSGTSHPRLDLVIHHQDPVLIQHFLQSLKIVVWWNYVTPLTLDGLDKHGRHILWWRVLV